MHPVDAHQFIHDDPRAPGCWATLGGVTDCGRTPASDIGLCPRHLAEIRDDAPRPLHPRRHGATATFVLADELTGDVRVLTDLTLHEWTIMTPEGER